MQRLSRTPVSFNPSLCPSHHGLPRSYIRILPGFKCTETCVGDTYTNPTFANLNAKDTVLFMYPTLSTAVFLSQYKTNDIKFPLTFENIKFCVVFWIMISGQMWLIKVIINFFQTLYSIRGMALEKIGFQNMHFKPV